HFSTYSSATEIYTLSLHDALPILLYGNLPPREISMKDVFRSGDSSKKFKIAEGQWYRYAPSYVSPAYHLLELLRRITRTENILQDRKSGSAGMPRPISYAVFCLKKKKNQRLEFPQGPNRRELHPL